MATQAALEAAMNLSLEFKIRRNRKVGLNRALMQAELSPFVWACPFFIFLYSEVDIMHACVVMFNTNTKLDM
jgi:hypothetical protein